ncbi:hypothetical protein RJ639_038188 [Escallonia herrerae]|uniref:Protein kinase domain-containing protein n=1 Tax=Escallonia herrerae TaxID=1293975 RepID=A0AA88WYR2_9ASTE|nr:hypothetical protein RJ639_038188 [Escallonia herrerae]
MAMGYHHINTSIFFSLLLCLLLHLPALQAQQTYVNNKQLDCEQNYTTALGYICNGPSTSCASYLTFRSTPTYNSPASIGYLLAADPSAIALINNVSDVSAFPSDTLVLVPLNCSCSSGRRFYQHNASYSLKTTTETYFSVANNTYQGLSTCQSLISQNPYNYRQLSVLMKLTVPLRCACPTSNQTAAGVKYLLTYLITWNDDVTSIGNTFGVVDNRSIFDANELSTSDIIFPFTPILVPLKSEPAISRTNATVPSPPPPPGLPEVPDAGGSSASKKWVFVGVGVGAACLLLVLLSGFLFCFFRRSRKQGRPSPAGPRTPKKTDESADYTALPETNAWSVSSEGVKYAIESLTVYKFEDLQEATGFFGEANRIGGSVYRGSFKGDAAAVKMMKGDIFSEINILKQINHSNIIRLSGFCVHQGNTYLVYEYAENGSLSDWLHPLTKRYQGSFMSTALTWKQRVQIAYDVADALNYLHNYSNPPYIHKNLKSSNVLLDGNMKAKVANFGLARTLDNQDQGGLQLTRHVMGTYGYMAPEYIENGLITPKLDVFALGVVMLELLSGKEAAGGGGEKKDGKDEELLFATIVRVLAGENVREKLREFIDPRLRGNEYPLDLAYSMTQLARNCVAHDLNSRPTMSEVFMTLSKILSSTVDWDPSDELEHSRSLSRGR